MTTPNDVIVDLRKLDFCVRMQLKLGRMDPYRLKFIFLKNNKYYIFFKITTPNDVIVDLRKLDFCVRMQLKLGRMDPYRLKFIFLKSISKNGHAQ